MSKGLASVLSIVFGAVVLGGCSIGPAPNVGASPSFVVMETTSAPDGEGSAVEHLRLDLPWSSAEAMVERELVAMGLRLRTKTGGRARFVATSDAAESETARSTFVEVVATGDATGEATRVTITRSLDPESAWRARAVKRALEKLRAPPPAAQPAPPPPPPPVIEPAPPPGPVSTPAPPPTRRTPKQKKKKAAL